MKDKTKYMHYLADFAQITAGPGLCLQYSLMFSVLNCPRPYIRVK